MKLEGSFIEFCDVALR